MSDKQIRNLSHEIKNCGKFDSLLQFLKNESSISHKNTLCLIISICHACINNTNNPEKLSEEHIVESIKKLVVNIEKTSDEEFMNYIRTMYHICVFLLKKDLQLILKIEPEIVPRFVPETLTLKQKIVYEGICDIIHNTIHNMMKSNEGIEREKLISMYNLTSRILSKSGCYEVYSRLMFSYHVHMMNLNVDLLIQYKNFYSALDIFEHLKANSEVYCKSMMNFCRVGMFVYCAFMKKGMIKKCLDCSECILKVIPDIKEWKILKRALSLTRSILNKNLNELRQCKEALIDSKIKFGKSDNLKIVCEYISTVLNTFAHFCKNSEQGVKYINNEIHEILCDIFHEILTYFTLNYTTCNGLCTCSSTRNIPESSKIAGSLSILTSTSMITTKSDEIIKKCLACLEKYSNFLTSLKNNNCSNWDKWDEISPFIYNLGVHSFKKENYKSTSTICEFILKFHDTLRNDNSVLTNTVNLYASTLLKLKKYEESMLFTTLEAINTRGTTRDSALTRLIKIKASAKEAGAPTDIQEFTVGLINEKLPKKYKCYMGEIVTNKPALEQLIRDELRIYQKKWKSKIPMMASFKQLSKIADDLELMRIFVEIFGDWQCSVHENTVQILESIFVRFQQSKNLEKYKIYHVFLNAFRYRTQRKELMSKLVKTHSNNTPKTSEVPEVMPSDADEKCEIISSNNDLKIAGTHLNYLKTAMKLLKEIVAEDISKHFHEVEIERVYDLCKNIAFEFNLHSEFYYSFETLLVTLKLAEYSGNRRLIFEISGILLKQIHSEELEKKAGKLISKLIAEEKNNELILDYHTNLANCYLSMEYFQLATKYFNEARKNLLGKCRKHYSYIEFQLLMFKFMQNPNTKDLTLKFSYKPIIEAYQLIEEKYCSDQDFGSQHLSLMLEIYEILVKVFHDLKMPKYVRHFGRYGLSTSQHHGLPKKRVKFMTYLAYADFRSCRYDDCKVKLNDISENLSLKIEKNKESYHKNKNNVTSLVDGLTDRVRDLVMNDGDFRTISTTLVPQVQTELYKLPDFCQHESCKCFQCMSFEHQMLVMNYFHLAALTFASDKKTTISNSYFRGALEFGELLLNHKNSISKTFNENLETLWYSIDGKTRNFQLTISEFPLNDLELRCSINYAKFLHCSGAFELSKKLFDKIWKKLKNHKDMFPNLYSEVLLLKLCSFEEKKLDDKHELVNSPKCLPDLTESSEISENTKPSKERRMNSVKECKTPFKTPKRRLPISLRPAFTPLPANNTDSKVEEPKTPLLMNRGITKRTPLLEISEDVKVPNQVERKNLFENINEKEANVKPKLLDIRTKLLTTKIKKKVADKVSSEKEAEYTITTRSNRRKLYVPDKEENSVRPVRSSSRNRT